MASRGRPTIQISLTDEERATLQRWSARRSSSQGLARRSRIVLACDQGRVSPTTWCRSSRSAM